MHLNMAKGHKSLEEKLQKALRKKTLADPQGYGLRGSLSDGINAKEMRELARQYEQREATRIAKERRNSVGNVKGTTRRLARPLPDIITSRWVWKARVAELQNLMMERGGKTAADLMGKGINDLRTMAAPLVTHGRKRPGKAKKPREASEDRLAKIKKFLDLTANPKDFQLKGKGECVGPWTEDPMLKAFMEDYPDLAGVLIEMFERLKRMIAPPAPEPKKPERFKLFCMKCGFPMVVEPSELEAGEKENRDEAEGTRKKV